VRAPPPRDTSADLLALLLALLLAPTASPFSVCLALLEELWTHLVRGCVVRAGAILDICSQRHAVIMELVQRAQAEPVALSAGKQPSVAVLAIIEQRPADARYLDSMLTGSTRRA